LGNDEVKSGPNSERMTCVVMTSTPSMVVMFTPIVRCGSAAKSKTGWFFLQLMLALLLRFSGPRIRTAPFADVRQAARRQDGQISWQLDIARGDLLLVEIVRVHNLLQFEQDVLAPIPLQTVCDLLLAGRDPSIAQLSQLTRIPLPLQNRPNDRLARYPAHIANRV